MAHYSGDFTRRLLLEAGLREGMRVLDAGCGNGEVTLLIEALVGATGTVVGVDQNSQALESARQCGGRSHFVEADLTSLPRDLRDFDAVVGRRVLMYQPDAVGAVRHLAARLRSEVSSSFRRRISRWSPPAWLLCPFMNGPTVGSAR